MKLTGVSEKVMFHPVIFKFNVLYELQDQDRWIYNGELAERQIS